MKATTKKRTTRTATKRITRKPIKRATPKIDKALLNKLGLWATTLRELKPGSYFTLSPIEYPKESQVWVKEHAGYDRASKTFACYGAANIAKERFFKPDRIVYCGFYF